MVPTIGILAGMGAHSTAPFIEMVLNECQRQYGPKHDIDFPPMMIHSCPTPIYIGKHCSTTWSSLLFAKDCNGS